jgi:ubiquinone/menaquinone biosynthesis C-methylase UbiE
MSQVEQEFFDSIKDMEEYDIFPEAFYDRILQNTLHSLYHKSLIIDVGCGSGAWSARIAKKGHIVIGIDISKRMVRNGYQLLKDNRTDFFGICADACNLPIRNDISDCVIYAFSLHHIPKISGTLQEASRCLKPKGLLILIEPNGSNPIRRISTIIGKSFNRTKRYRFSSPLERSLSIHLISNLLKTCRFSTIFISVDSTLIKTKKTNIIIITRDLLMNITSMLFPNILGAINFMVMAHKNSEEKS